MGSRAANYMKGMKKYIPILMVLLTFCSVGCKDVQKDENKRTVGEPTEQKSNTGKGSAEAILTEAITAHGGVLYDDAYYQFIFRDKLYSFNNQNGYVYTLKAKDSVGNQINDTLRNGNFSRAVNGELVALSPKEVAIHSNALNSVIYFALIPYKLNDTAVLKEYEGETSINGEDYDVVSITFKEEGGGKDHDDIFMYWIHKTSHFVNYLAYSYEVNGGGVRFRSAYNPSTVDGIRFQDYINWEAPLRTPLKKLPSLFEAGQLKELSKIENQEIQNLNPSKIQE